MGKITKFREVTRQDRGVIANANPIVQTFGADSNLVNNIIYFLGAKCVSNLFGELEFSTSEFAKFMEISTKNLYDQHPALTNNPKERKRATVAGHEFSTVIEYTLLEMTRRAVLLSNVRYYQNEIHTNVTGMLLLESMTIINPDKKAANKPFIYRVRLNPNISHNLFNSYLLVENKSYINVGKGKGGAERKMLYNVLCARINTMVSETHFYKNKFTVSVDYLIKIMQGVSLQSENILATEPRFKKRFLIRKLDSIKALSSLDFTYEFSGHTPISEAYQITITFSDQTLNNFTSLDYVKFQSAIYKELFEYYEKKYGEGKTLQLNVNGFNEWVIDFSPVAKEDESKKINTVISCYKRYFKREINKDEALFLLSTHLDENSV